MTTYLADPNDTGEIERGDLERTQNLGPKIAAAMLAHRSPLRSADATEEIPVVGEEPLFTQLRQPGTLYGPGPGLATEIFGFDPGPYPPVEPPTPPPPPPAPGKYRSEQRARFAPHRMGRRGRHAAPAPAWTRWAVWIGVTLFALSAPSVAVLAVIR